MFQSVPYSLLGFDKSCQALLLQLLRKRLTLTDKVLSSIEKVAIPEFPHQVITRHDITRMFKQDPQNLKFILGQTQDFPLDSAGP